MPRKSVLSRRSLVGSLQIRPKSINTGISCRRVPFSCCQPRCQLHLLAQSRMRSAPRMERRCTVVASLNRGCLGNRRPRDPLVTLLDLQSGSGFIPQPEGINPCNLLGSLPFLEGNIFFHRTQFGSGYAEGRREAL